MSLSPETPVKTPPPGNARHALAILSRGEDAPTPPRQKAKRVILWERPLLVTTEPLTPALADHDGSD